MSGYASCFRNFTVLFCLSFFGFGATLSSAESSLQSQAQLGVYLKSAFARSEYLVKPKRPNFLVVKCSALAKSKCSALVAKIQMFVPIDISLQEDISSSANSSIELYVFMDPDDRRKHQVQLTVEAGLQQAVYDDGNCAAVQFLKGYEVKKGLVVVLLSQGARLSEACAISQIARTSGLSFRQRFSELASNISAMSESEFSDSKSMFRALLEYHFNPSLHAGMTESQANSLLKTD